MESKASQAPDEKLGTNGNDNANPNPPRKVLPPPPPQSPFRQYVDRKVTVVMHILGLI
jgi:hypothetical protein